MKLIAAALLTASALLVQAQSPAPAFEVAAVKLSGPDCGQSGRPFSMSVDKSRFSAGCQQLKTLIYWAYSVKADQVAGPDFLASVHVDIEAKLPAAATSDAASHDIATEDQARTMLQALLADRFKMTIHRD